MKKFVLFVSVFLSISLDSHALTFGGYTLDESTDVVSTSTLEWLQWDKTQGMSVQQYFADDSLAGWRLATNEEMSKLFYDFELGTFDTDPSTSETIKYDWDADEGMSAVDRFISFFGQTLGQDDPFCDDSTAFCQDNDGYSNDDPLRGSRAFFGTGTENGKFNSAIAYDDYTQLVGFFAGENDALTGILKNAHRSDTPITDGYGLALVRDVTPVPVPAAFPLFLSALVGFGLLRRRKLSPR